MAVSEQARFELHERLMQTLGNEAAATMMDLLPPVGWSDVATSRDIVAVRNDVDRLEAVMEARFQGVDHRFKEIEHRIEASADKMLAVLYSEIGKLRQELAAQNRTLVLQNRTLMVGLTAMVVAILVRLPGT